MKQGTRTAIPLVLFGSALILLFVLLMQPIGVLSFERYIDVLFPAGIIGIEQRNLLLIIQALMLLVILPVYILTFVFSWRYRANGSKKLYDPHLVDNVLAEVIWWGLPLVITAIIAVITLVKTYELDPFKPIVSDKPTKTIQVVALQWKWLFIYPEENIASLNFVQLPENTPIRFEVTADAPMNAFWIPKLGGMIYAMPSMKTELNLIANQTGDFFGRSANLSGKGFSNMQFIARSSTEEEFDKWVKEAKSSEKSLNYDGFNVLAEPSEDNAVAFFKLEDANLFHRILMKYQPQESHE